MSEQPEPWPGDGWADAVALVEAWRRDDETTTQRVALILRHGNMLDTALCLSKCLAAVADEQEIDPVHFRRWSADAVTRQP